MNSMTLRVILTVAVVGIECVWSGVIAPPPPLYSYAEVKHDSPKFPNRIQRSSSPHHNSYGSGYTPSSPSAAVGYAPQSYAPSRYSPINAQQSYAVPNQQFHSQPVTYTPPQITFHPPQIIVTKSGVTYANSNPSPYGDNQMAIPYSPVAHSPNSPSSSSSTYYGGSGMPSVYGTTGDSNSYGSLSSASSPSHSTVVAPSSSYGNSMSPSSSSSTTSMENYGAKASAPYPVYYRIKSSKNPSAEDTKSDTK